MAKVCAFVLSAIVHTKPNDIKNGNNAQNQINQKPMKKIFSLMLLLATIFTFTSCGGDDEEPDNTKLSKTSYALYHEETQGIEGTNISDLAWNSENEFVATVKSGVITGRYVGKTVVETTKNLSFTVEVKPRYHTYEEPSLEWGASKATIKAKYGTPYSENATGLIYKTTNSNAPMMTFIFENNKMSNCGVVCKISIASQLADFLLERYVPVKVDTNNYSATLLHCYGKINDPQIDFGVAMQYSSSIGGILVAYTPTTTSSKSRGSDDVDFDRVFNVMEQILR